MTAVRQTAGREATLARAGRSLLLPILVAGVLGAVAPAASAASTFQVGAATGDITPPAYSSASDSAFVPACATTPAQVSQLWPGRRLFEFEKPYVDLYGLGRYAPGDPYCDADHTGRYEAPYLAGGSGENHWPVPLH